MEVKLGGDNFEPRGCFTWDSALEAGADGWRACKGPAIGGLHAPTITNWRKVWLWPTQMSPDYNPLVDLVPGAFDDAFVEVVKRQLETAPHAQTNYCEDANNWAHNSTSYPKADSAPYHPPPNHMPHHSGIDRFIDKSFGYYCGENHSFTAVSILRGTYYGDEDLIERMVKFTTLHELGHNLGGLAHIADPPRKSLCGNLPPRDRTVMRYSCRALLADKDKPLPVYYFSVEEIKQMRNNLRDIYIRW